MSSLTFVGTWTWNLNCSLLGFAVIFVAFDFDPRQQQKIIVQHAYLDNKTSLLQNCWNKYAKLENFNVQAAPPSPDFFGWRASDYTMTSVQGSNLRAPKFIWCKKVSSWVTSYSRRWRWGIWERAIPRWRWRPRDLDALHRTSPSAGFPSPIAICSSSYMSEESL